MKIVIDVMSRKDDIWLATLGIEPSLKMITDYYEDKPVVSVNALRKTIEKKRPTLRFVDYRIFPCNENFVLNYD